MRHGTRWVVMALAMMVWLSTEGWAQIARPDPGTLAKAIQAIEHVFPVSDARLDVNRSKNTGLVYGRSESALVKGTLVSKVGFANPTNKKTHGNLM